MAFTFKEIFADYRHLVGKRKDLHKVRSSLYRALLESKESFFNNPNIPDPQLEFRNFKKVWLQLRISEVMDEISLLGMHIENRLNFLESMPLTAAARAIVDKAKAKAAEDLQVLAMKQYENYIMSESVIAFSNKNLKMLEELGKQREIDRKKRLTAARAAKALKSVDKKTKKEVKQQVQALESQGVPLIAAVAEVSKDVPQLTAALDAVQSAPTEAEKAQVQNAVLESPSVEQAKNIVESSIDLTDNELKKIDSANTVEQVAQVVEQIPSQTDEIEKLDDMFGFTPEELGEPVEFLEDINPIESQYDSNEYWDYDS